MIKMKRILLLGTILFIFLSVPSAFDIIGNSTQVQITDQSPYLTPDEAAIGDGIYETKNFIPTESSHFYHSSSGAALWTYPDAQTYSDTYWGASGLIVNGKQTNYKTVTQSRTQDNRYIYDAATTVPSSTDFTSAGFGSIRIDPRKRSRDFYTNDTDAQYSVVQTTPTYVGNVNGQWNATASWTSTGSSGSGSTNYYPANREVSTRNYYTTNNNQWSYGNNMMKAYSSYTDDLDLSTQSLSGSFYRRTWYACEWPPYPASTSGTHTISMTWDSTSSYTMEVRQYFYYVDTTTSTIATYSGDVVVSPRGNLKYTTVTGGNYDVDILGSVVYEIRKFDDTLVTSSVKSYFTESESTGLFNRTDFSIPQSSNFGNLLSTGWFYLAIKIGINHRQMGSNYRSGSYTRISRLADYGDIGVNFNIDSPSVQIYESSPIDVLAGKQEFLVESDWIDWGVDRNIVTNSNPKMTFGYQVPNSFKGYAGGAESLQNGRIIAYLIIDRPGGGTQDLLYRYAATKTFDQIWGINNGNGTGCDKFIWAFNNTVIAGLDGAIAIKWKIGMSIQTGLELSYFSDSYSRIYFNNIDCTLLTGILLKGTFTIRNVDGLLEEGYQTHVVLKQGTAIRTGLTTTGVVSIDKLYNATYPTPWRMIVNITQSGKNYTIFNASYPINHATSSFSDTIYANLTNIIYTIKDQISNNLVGAKVQIKNIAKPSDIRIGYTDSGGNITFREVYNGNWQVVVNVTQSGEQLTIYNATRSISNALILKPQKYLLAETITADLTNAKIRVRTPSGTNFPNAKVTLTNIAVPSFVKFAYTNSTSYALVRELMDGTYRLTVTALSSYIVMNRTYIINTNANLISESFYYNLTNLVIRANDYAGIPIGNDVSGLAYLKTGSTLLQKSLVNGNATFAEIWNSTGWRLIVNVTVSGRTHTIYNITYGINTASSVIYRTFNANLTTAEFTIFDKDSVLISGAKVILRDPNVGKYLKQFTTDSSGKVTFLEAYYITNWNLTIQYTVQGSGSSTSTIYQIYQDLNYNQINPTSNLDYRITRSILNCNLTTLNLYVTDGSISDIQYAGLNLANVTLVKPTNSQTLAVFRSNANGYIQMKLPATSYNFTIKYISTTPRDFYFNGTGDSTPKTTKQLIILSKTNARMYVSLTGNSTRLSIIGYSYKQTSWPHDAQFGTLPYSISMYYGDNVKLSLNYSDVKQNVALNNVGLTGSSWTFVEADTLVTQNSSTNVAALYTGTLGIFNLSIYGTNYKAGSYKLSFLFIKAGNYIETRYELLIQILNHTTSLTTIESRSELSVFWQSTVKLWINYTTVLPVVSNATNAIVTYSVSGTTLTGTLTHQGVTTGLYSVDLVTSSLKVAIYRIDIIAYQGNLTLLALSEYFEIKALKTSVNTNIPTAYRLNPTSLKTAYDENLTIYFNYTYFSTGLGISGASYSAYLDTPLKVVPMYTWIGGNYQFNITQNANLFTIGSHILYIVAQKANHENYTLIINVEVVTKWTTRLDLIIPPAFTSWANNATFEINYFATESPRTNQPLTDAVISQLNITYTVGTVEYQKLILTSSNYKVWGWNELATPGHYLVWFNTSILDITEDSVFYAIPTISYANYYAATNRPYVWVSPLSTVLTLSMDNAVVTNVNLYKDDVKELKVNLNVSDSQSGLYKRLVSGAKVTYKMYNVSTDLVVVQGELLPISGQNGFYAVNITASNLGLFRIEVDMELLNHTLTEIPAFSWEVNYVPVSFRVSINPDIRLSSSAIKLAHNEVINFTLTFLQTLAVYPDVTAKLKETELDVEDKTNGLFEISYPASAFTPGEYNITIIAQKEFTETKTMVLDINILDFWETTTTIISPPTVYPWNNISSFIISYSCIEEPRAGTLLGDGEITGLNITSKVGTGERSVHYFDATELNNMWGWNNLKTDPSYGSGYYEVWFNTSVVSIQEQSFFYAIPFINYSIYRQATARPYVWITPVETSIFALANPDSSVPLEALDLMLEQSSTIFAKLNVTDSASSLLGNLVSDTEVYYTIYNSSNAITKSGKATLRVDGLFEFPLHASTIGSFNIRIDSSKQNFTIYEWVFSFNVRPKAINLLGNLASEIKTPQNHEISFSIDLFDEVAGTELRGGIMTVNIGNQMFTFSESTTPGRYTATFTPEQLGTFDVKAYSAIVRVSKTNYTTFEQTITFDISLPVDPYLGVPYTYWNIIIVTAAVMVSAVIMQQVVKNARIPLYIKQISATRKLIARKRVIPGTKITSTNADELIQRFANRWTALDLNLGKILKEGEGEKKEFATSSDQPQGGNQ